MNRPTGHDGNMFRTMLFEGFSGFNELFLTWLSLRGMLCQDLESAPTAAPMHKGFERAASPL